MSTILENCESSRCLIHFTMWSCENEYVEFIAKRGVNCAHSIIGNNLRLLSREYGVTIDTLGQVKLKSNTCSIEDMAAVQAIRDINFGTIPGFFTEEDLNILLHDLCEL